MPELEINYLLFTDYRKFPMYYLAWPSWLIGRASASCQGERVFKPVGNFIIFNLGLALSSDEMQPVQHYAPVPPPPPQNRCIMLNHTTC